MRLLLDTHIALWLAIEEHKLTHGERAILSEADELPFEVIYGAWPGFVVRHQGGEAVQRSAERYIRALEVEL